MKLSIYIKVAMKKMVEHLLSGQSKSRPVGLVRIKEDKKEKSKNKK